jgi:hypothetical protein
LKRADNEERMKNINQTTFGQQILIMKKMIALLALSCAISFTASAVNHTNNPAPPLVVSWYTFPTSLPNDADIVNFPIARAVVMNGLALYGGSIMATGSRSNNPAGVVIRTAFEVGDMIVVNNPGSTTNYVWRSQMNPTNPYYIGCVGSRIYVPFIAVANGTNKISLSGFSFNVIDPKGYFSGQSALETNYAISEVGLIKGPSGQLFGNDHTIVSSGSSTNLVDGVVFIGARVGADVSQYGQLGVNAVNSYIGTSDVLRFIYSYTYSGTDTNGDTVVNTENNERDVTVYQDGQTPASQQGMGLFRTPRGWLFSITEPETNTYTTWVSRVVNGPYTLNSSSATTGWSYEWEFTGANVNDTGFVKWTNNVSSF